MAPVTEVVPQTGTVIEGGNFTLICNASGVPSPSVVWTEVGSPVILSQKISLTVANVTRPGTRDNLIQYQCTARNGVGTSSTTTVSIAVHCEFMVIQCSITMSKVSLHVYGNGMQIPRDRMLIHVHGKKITILYEKITS